MKRITIALAFLFSVQAYSQSPEWVWAVKAEGYGSDRGTDVATDVNGNVYITGNYLSSPLSFGSDTIWNGSGGYEIFLAKYDSTGNLIWAKNIGPMFSNDIAVDHSGNVYVAGQSGSSGFLVKYSTTGNWLWTSAFAGDFGAEGDGVTVDENGFVYLTGSFASTSITLDSITLTNFLPGYYDLFIAKYNSAGHVLWAKSVGDSNDETSSAIAVDTIGNVYITGQFYGFTFDFGNTTLSNPNNGADAFIAKFDNIGNHIWAKSMAGMLTVYASDITVDTSGNAYALGYFRSASITLDTITLTNANASGIQYDIFLAKYDSNGDILWAKRVGGAYSEKAYHAANDAAGNVYIAGEFQSNSITLDSIVLTNAGSIFWTDVLVIKYGPEGNVLWAKSAGGTQNDGGSGVAVDAFGNAFVTGFFHSPNIAFGNITLISTTNSDEVFVAKLNLTAVGINEYANDQRIFISPNPAIRELRMGITDLKIEGIEYYNCWTANLKSTSRKKRTAGNYY